MNHYDLDQQTARISKVQFFTDYYKLGGMILFGVDDQILHKIGVTAIGQGSRGIKITQTETVVLQNDEKIVGVRGKQKQGNLVEFQFIIKKDDNL